MKKEKLLGKPAVWQPYHCCTVLAAASNNRETTQVSTCVENIVIFIPCGFFRRWVS